VDDACTRKCTHLMMKDVELLQMSSDTFAGKQMGSSTSSSESPAAAAESAFFAGKRSQADAQKKEQLKEAISFTHVSSLIFLRATN